MFRVPGLIITDKMGLVTLEFFNVPDGESWIKEACLVYLNNIRKNTHSSTGIWLFSLAISQYSVA
jgi:hypothetical protein